MLSHSSLQHAKACKGEQHSAAAAHHDKLYRLARRRSNLAVDGPSPTARILIITSVSWVALRFVQSYLSPWDIRAVEGMGHSQSYSPANVLASLQGDPQAASLRHLSPL